MASDVLEVLFANIDAVADELEALARPAELERRAPDALGELMKRAEIPMAKVPRAIGGYEIKPEEQVDYFARLSYHNPTAGWLAFNQNGVAGMLGATLPDAGVERVFGAGPPLTAAVSAPTGKSTKVDGGYRVSGKWAYASGAHVADFYGLATFCDDPAGPRMVVLTQEQVQIEDNWHVAALQGTGSVDIVVDDVFVEDDLTTSPLLQLRGGKQYTGFPYKVYVAGENYGFSLGVAKRLVDEVARLAKSKKRLMDPTTIGERGAFQNDLARAHATMDAASALMRECLREAYDEVETSQALLSAETTMRVEANMAWATETLVKVGTMLFPYAGAGSLHLDSPIQRAFRDLVGSGQHYVASNEALDVWGQYLVRNAK